MGKRETTEAQKKYKIFDKRRQIIIKSIITIFILIIAAFVLSIRYSDSNSVPLLIVTGVLIVYVVTVIIVCNKIANKHNELYTDAYGNDTEVIHTGLFAEIVEAFEWNQFEDMIDGKVVFSEMHNNTIEIEIIRKKHEIHVAIDSEVIYIVVDEETDTPIEKEIPLSEILDIDQFYTVLRKHIENEY